MELAESSAEAQQRSRRAMARHDTVKYEADSLYLAFRRLQYSTKKRGDFKIGDSVRQAPDLGKPPCPALASLMIVTAMTISFNLPVLSGNCKLMLG
jgi:hypothetical protein